MTEAVMMTGMTGRRMDGMVEGVVEGVGGGGRRRGLASHAAHGIRHVGIRRIAYAPNPRRSMGPQRRVGQRWAARPWWWRRRSVRALPASGSAPHTDFECRLRPLQVGTKVGPDPSPVGVAPEPYEKISPVAPRN
jgi:hypothetical protein